MDPMICEPDHACTTTGQVVRVIWAESCWIPKSAASHNAISTCFSLFSHHGTISVNGCWKTNPRKALLHSIIH